MRSLLAVGILTALASWSWAAPPRRTDQPGYRLGKVYAASSGAEARQILREAIQASADRIAGRKPKLESQTVYYPPNQPGAIQLLLPRTHFSTETRPGRVLSSVEVQRTTFAEPRGMRMVWKDGKASLVEIENHDLSSRTVRVKERALGRWLVVGTVETSGTDEGGHAAAARRRTYLASPGARRALTALKGWLSRRTGKP
jgi:hypothetical protein